MSARVLVAALLLTLAGPACSRSDGPSEPSAGGAQSASVRGTVVDAGTRLPVAGARIQGPGGVRSVSDDAGRFQLGDLPPGTDGEVVATGPDGSVGRVPLLPLKSGALEVVVHLRQP